MARLGREHLGDMSDEGQRVRERRERLGLDKKSLAEQAGVNRNTLAAIESGDSFNRSSLAKIERVLSDLEREAGIDAPPAKEEQRDLMEIRAEGVYGIQSIVVGGPVSDRDELVETIARLIERVRNGESGRNDDKG